MLYTNKTLRKIELEGNLLGPKTIKEFGKALKHNKSLMLLDLESNQFTREGEDRDCIEFFINALENNKHLLSLNMANNRLEASTGTAFKHCLEKNLTLIDFEFGFNQFTLEDVRQIQIYLRRNKAKFDADRLREWRERKDMRTEDEALAQLYLKENVVEEK